MMRPFFIKTANLTIQQFFMFDLALLSNVDKSDSFRSFGMIPMVDLWNNHPDDTEFPFVGMNTNIRRSIPKFDFH